MNERQRHNLRMILGVLVGIMAFIVGFWLAAFAGVILFFSCSGQISCLTRS